MRTIRLIQADELDQLATVTANAYPRIDMFSDEARAQFIKRVAGMLGRDDVRVEGLFEGDELRGAMRLYDFTMTYGRDTELLVGGVGSVAVDLLHKKERVAFDLLQYFLRYYRERGAGLVALYPFRPDFYHKMGFGFGTQIQRYRFAPSSLPKGAKADVVRLTKDDRSAVAACYDRYRARTHGMFDRADLLWDSLFDNESIHMVGVVRHGRVCGYLFYEFQQGDVGHFLDNKMLIREWVADSAEDWQQLATFLHSQADQVGQIVYHSFDPNLRFVLHDPRDTATTMMTPTLYHTSSQQGVGLMWRVVDVAHFFELLPDHDFGGQSLSLAISAEDSFLPENETTTTLVFDHGRVRVADVANPDVEIQLDIADLSSWVMGAVRLETLLGYGLVQLSDDSALPSLSKLFDLPDPICLISF